MVPFLPHPGHLGLHSTLVAITCPPSARAGPRCLSWGDARRRALPMRDEPIPGVVRVGADDGDAVALADGVPGAHEVVWVNLPNFAPRPHRSGDLRVGGPLDLVHAGFPGGKRLIRAE